MQYLPTALMFSYSLATLLLLLRIEQHAPYNTIGSSWLYSGQVAGLRNKASTAYNTVSRYKTPVQWFTNLVRPQTG